MLILTGRYVGFLPDHYARTFVGDCAMARVPHPKCKYHVQFSAISCRSQAMPRVAHMFLAALATAHDLRTPRSLAA